MERIYSSLHQVMDFDHIISLTRIQSSKNRSASPVPKPWSSSYSGIGVWSDRFHCSGLALFYTGVKDLTSRSSIHLYGKGRLWLTAMLDSPLDGWYSLSPLPIVPRMNEAEKLPQPSLFCSRILVKTSIMAAIVYIHVKSKVQSLDPVCVAIVSLFRPCHLKWRSWPCLRQSSRSRT